MLGNEYGKTLPFYIVSMFQLLNVPLPLWGQRYITWPSLKPFLYISYINWYDYDLDVIYVVTFSRLLFVVLFVQRTWMS